jgi:putative transposase
LILSPLQRRVLAIFRERNDPQKNYLSTIFGGQAVAIKEVEEGIWLVDFMNYDLGYFDLDTRVLEPLENPFGPKLLPMWPVCSVATVSGSDPEGVVGAKGFEPSTSWSRTAAVKNLTR